MATTLKELIEDIEKDDLPTNEFTIEDEDPMVILGKLNEVIAYLETLQATINASDSKANEALQKAIQAVADATQALSVANGIDAKATQALANAIEAVGTANTALSASNTALSTANTAISTANTALSSANSAVETAENALDTAESAETKADTAITTANGAKTTAEGIDAKATTALSNSQTAVSTANTAETKAQEALDQVVAGLGTKVYRDTTLLNSLDIKPIEDDIANNTTAITALQNGKVDKVAGKQLSTEDFTTAEKSKLAGLNNYDDAQVQADISTLMADVEELGNEINTTNSNLNTEATARQSADTTLQNNINSETTARQNADTTLQNNIDINTQKINLINKTATLLYSGNPSAKDIINLSQPITEFSYIMLQTVTNGETRPSVIVPVNQIENYTQNSGYIANASISGTTRQTVFNFYSSTAIRIGIKTNTSTVTVYGIK